MAAELLPVVWPEAICPSVCSSEGRRGGVSFQSVCQFRISSSRHLAGEYPNGLVEAAPQLHIHGKSSADSKAKYVEIGDPIGLYRLSLGDGMTQSIISPLV
jgi:hypothetical protein